MKSAMTLSNKKCLLKKRLFGKIKKFKKHGIQEILKVIVPIRLKPTLECAACKYFLEHPTMIGGPYWFSTSFRSRELNKGEIIK